MDKTNLQVIRESFGRVVYSHKTHEKNAEIYSCRTIAIKWVNIILTTLTSGTLVSTIITNQDILIYISATLSALTLAFIIFQLSFNPETEAEKHRQIAKELWYVREKYVNLMADLLTQKISDETIISRRDNLTEELKMIYKFAPITSTKAYRKAQKALKINEELTFSDEEIDQFLPQELKSKI
ncbi:MAG: SLATT domain-containing protein [Methanoregula sp.]|jgi:hypothetical protein|nr:SLATT domain-containing protein [Methanoregula sp.]